MAAARLRRIGLLIAIGGGMASLGGAQPLPGEDLDFLVEHLLEATMDARFSALPAPSERYEAGRWQAAVDLGWQSAKADGLEVAGGLLAVDAGVGVGDGRGIELAAFFDRASLSGRGGDRVLRPLWSRSLPLDLPQRAQISSPDGEVESWGVGLAYVRQRPESASGGRWTWRFGLLYDRLEARGLRAAYRLLSGRFAGLEGVADYSSSYGYTTPWIEVERRRPLGSRWTIGPHAGFFYPWPRRGFAGRLSGPGFDVAGDTGAARGLKHMGDPALALGIRFDDRRSGLGIDLGATLFHALTEGVEHSGIDEALLLQLSWQPRRR